MEDNNTPEPTAACPQRTAAYPGSLIQQNHGEPASGHGFLLWDITTGKADEHEVPSDYGFRTVMVDMFCDYANPDITMDDPVPHPRIRVQWRDSLAAMDRDNEQLIREHLQQRYNPLEIEFDKQPVGQTTFTVSESEADPKRVSLLEVQRELFREYLAETGHGQEYIDQVIALDELVEQRIGGRYGQESAASYGLLRVWGENIFSYDTLDVRLGGRDGLIQIEGPNEAGKTTLYKTVCYVLFGETLETRRKVRHGDNRFLNNKRSLDHCTGGIILSVGGRTYALVRRTERQVKKGEIRSVSSKLTFHHVAAGQDGSGAIDWKTPVSETEQQHIIRVTGGFDRFLRMALTTSDTLNNLLSTTRSEFLDALLQDLGLDMFERKLTELRQYRKEYQASHDRLVTTPHQIETTLATLASQRQAAEAAISETDNQIRTLQARIAEGTRMREQAIRAVKSLPQPPSGLPDRLRSMDAQALTSEKEKLSGQIDRLSAMAENIDAECAGLPDSFDADALERLTLAAARDRTWHHEASRRMKELVRLGTGCENEANRARTTLERIPPDGQPDQAQSDMERQSADTAAEIKQLEFESGILHAETERLMQLAAEQEAAIRNGDGSDNCHRCGTLLEGDATIRHARHLEAESGTLQQTRRLIGESTGKSVRTSERLETCRKHLHVLSIRLATHKQTIAGERAALRTEQSRLLEAAKSEQSWVGDGIATLNAEIAAHDLHMEGMLEDHGRLVLEQSRFMRRQTLMIERQGLEAQSADLARQAADTDTHIRYLTTYALQIRENAEFEGKVAAYTAGLAKLTAHCGALSSEMAVAQAGLAINESERVRWEAIATQVSTQHQMDSLMKTYEKLVHRDGIPTRMLQRTVPLINVELTNLLAGIDLGFDIWLDENIDFLMCHHSTPGSNTQPPVQHILEGCGKERTFVSVALKTALNRVNFNARPEFILLDEITGKLVGDSVDQFRQLLSRMKRFYRHVLIIEHNHELEPDHVLRIEKNREGISSIAWE